MAFPLWSQVREETGAAAYFFGIVGLGWLIAQIVMDAIPPATPLRDLDITIGAAGFGLLCCAATLERSLLSLWLGGLWASAWGVLVAGIGTLNFIAQDGREWSDFLIETRVCAIAACAGGLGAILAIRRFLGRKLAADKML